MLITEDAINEYSQNLLISYFEAKDVYEKSVELSKDVVSDFNQSIMDLRVKDAFEKYVIRYTHMKIIENEFKSSINNHRWN